MLFVNKLKVVSSLFYVILIIRVALCGLKQSYERIADICYDEKVLVFSDEIHADLTLPPHTHRPFATVSEKARMTPLLLCLLASF